MTAHLRSCRRKHGSTSKKKVRKTEALHLVVEGEYQKEYWMHLEADVEGSLGDLDELLRHAWVECCGHLSAFEPIGKPKSQSAFDSSRIFDTFESNELDFETPLGTALSPKESLKYTYDFGSSTELLIRCVAQREAMLPPGSIEIQARNKPPIIVCCMCDEPATQVCTECGYEPDGWLYDDCIEDHECGDEMA